MTDKEWLEMLAGLSSDELRMLAESGLRRAQRYSDRNRFQLEQRVTKTEDRSAANRQYIDDLNERADRHSGQMEQLEDDDKTLAYRVDRLASELFALTEAVRVIQELLNGCKERARGSDG